MLLLRIRPSVAAWGMAGEPAGPAPAEAGQYPRCLSTTFISGKPLV
jgi:hypothetical protein